MLQTERLRLIPLSIELLEAAIHHPADLARLLDCRLSPDWPPEDFADAAPWFLEKLAQYALPTRWTGWLGITLPSPDQPATLIATGGFKGPPQAGAVEIGYSVVPSHQNRGFATEMIHALTAWAETHPEVETLLAEVFPHNAASLRVLLKLGFTASGTGQEPGTLRFSKLNPQIRAPGSTLPPL